MKKWHIIFLKKLLNIFCEKEKIRKLNIGILGLSFKENCPDIRNKGI